MDYHVKNFDYGLTGSGIPGIKRPRVTGGFTRYPGMHPYSSSSGFPPLRPYRMRPIPSSSKIVPSYRPYKPYGGGYGSYGYRGFSSRPGPIYSSSGLGGAYSSASRFGPSKPLSRYSAPYSSSFDAFSSGIHPSAKSFIRPIYSDTRTMPFYRRVY